MTNGHLSETERPVLDQLHAGGGGAATLPELSGNSGQKTNKHFFTDVKAECMNSAEQPCRPLLTTSSGKTK